MSEPTPKSANADSNEVQSILANSARSASFLISLQIGSRASTFVVNQTLVRFLSPELLGVSSQLELYAISVLYFARESIRVALGRQGQDTGSKDGPLEPRKIAVERYGLSRRAQKDINLSYIAIALGPLFAALFSWLYWRKPEGAVAAMPYLQESFYLYAIATLLELCIEPCFAVAQMQTLYGVRASAEGSATFTRCILNCAIAVWASKSGLSLGALPFAVGQLGFALVLNMIYWSKIMQRSKSGGFSMLPRALPSNDEHLLLSYFSRPTLTLALNLYAQSGLKHLLTQGDALLIAMFTSLSSQGIYALASNYGSLLARMLFQPIEESSRGVFGKLLAAQALKISTPADDRASSLSEKPSKVKRLDTNATLPTPASSLLSARSYLLTVLHFYTLLSLVLISLLPTLAPLALLLVAGPRWATTSAPDVLGLYAYYLPLLAFNGILEAFVTAVATPTQLQRQTGAMMGFSAGFAATGYLLLSMGDGGAKGLVGANVINMAIRILWSWNFVSTWFAERGAPINITHFLPRRTVVAAGGALAVALQWLGPRGSVNTSELLAVIGLGGLYGLLLLYLERVFLMDFYRTLRPAKSSAESSGTKEKRK